MKWWDVCKNFDASISVPRVSSVGGIFPQRAVHNEQNMPDEHNTVQVNAYSWTKEMGTNNKAETRWQWTNLKRLCWIDRYANDRVPLLCSLFQKDSSKQDENGADLSNECSIRSSTGHDDWSDLWSSRGRCNPSNNSNNLWSDCSSSNSSFKRNLIGKKVLIEVAIGETSKLTE